MAAFGCNVITWRAMTNLVICSETGSGQPENADLEFGAAESAGGHDALSPPRR